MNQNLINDSEESIKKAIIFLEQEKLVALQTETVYGIACDSSSIFALKNLYNLKGRPHYNPLIIHVDSIELANKIGKINSDASAIMEKFWPGPLTLILPKRVNNIVHDFATSGLDSVAIRYPNSGIMNKILNRFKKPLAAPSANESGYISATDANHVIDSFGNKIDLVIDSGRTKYGLESTILDMTKKPYELKRPGVIDYKLITENTGIKIVVDNQKQSLSNRPNSPGQLIKHYSPTTPLFINIKKPSNDDAFLNFGNRIFNHKDSLNLSSTSNLEEAAYNLFYFLRKLDKLKKKRIAVAPIPEVGIGKTINERLLRASI